MNADPDLLLDLAGAVSDGRPVDWSAVSVTPQADSMRDVIEEMAVLARVGELHRTFATTTGSEESAAPEDPNQTKLARWGDLLLLERVGAGTAGEVFRAYDNQLQREVALKLFYPDPDSTSSPLTEGRLLARVRHPNVVTVFGAAESGGRVGVWMEFIRGRTLGARVADEGPLSVREVVDMGIELCEALAAVHQAGLLHRDVKPQNVMLSHDGRVVLMDFSAGREQLGGDRSVAGNAVVSGARNLHGRFAVGRERSLQSRRPALPSVDRLVSSHGPQRWRASTRARGRSHAVAGEPPSQSLRCRRDGHRSRHLAHPK